MAHTHIGYVPLDDGDSLLPGLNYLYAPPPIMRFFYNVIHMCHLDANLKMKDRPAIVHLYVAKAMGPLKNEEK